MKKRILSLAMALFVTASTLPAMAFAAAGDLPDSGTVVTGNGLCKHHIAHTADCGYTEGMPEQPCNHQQTEDCCTLVTSCVHSCDESCDSLADLSACKSVAPTASSTWTRRASSRRKRAPRRLPTRPPTGMAVQGQPGMWWIPMSSSATVSP